MYLSIVSNIFTQKARERKRERLSFFKLTCLISNMKIGGLILISEPSKKAQWAVSITVHGPDSTFIEVDRPPGHFLP